VLSGSWNLGAAPAGGPLREARIYVTIAEAHAIPRTYPHGSPVLTAAVRAVLGLESVAKTCARKRADGLGRDVRSIWVPRPAFVSGLRHCPAPKAAVALCSAERELEVSDTGVLACDIPPQLFSFQRAIVVRSSDRAHCGFLSIAIYLFHLPAAL